MTDDHGEAGHRESFGGGLCLHLPSKYLDNQALSPVLPWAETLLKVGHRCIVSASASANLAAGAVKQIEPRRQHPSSSRTFRSTSTSRRSFVW